MDYVCLLSEALHKSHSHTCPNMYTLGKGVANKASEHFPKYEPDDALAFMMARSGQLFGHKRANTST